MAAAIFTIRAIFAAGLAKVQGGAHLLSKHYFRGFYRLSGAVGCGLHGASIRNVEAP
jgi:hypothetical protein